MNKFIGFQVSGDGKPSPVSTLVKIDTSPSKGIQMLFVRKSPAVFGYSIGLVRVGYGLQSVPRPTSSWDVHDPCFLEHVHAACILSPISFLLLIHRHAGASGPTSRHHMKCPSHFRGHCS